MKQRLSISVAWCIVGLWVATNSALLHAGCVGSEKVGAGDAAVIAVKAAAPLRLIEPHYFGFSFVWVEFHDSLWNDFTGRVDGTAIRCLKDFPGAVYRYPGGTESNYFDWNGRRARIWERRSVLLTS
jgi:hypothetical protein